MTSITAMVGLSLLLETHKQPQQQPNTMAKIQILNQFSLSKPLVSSPLPSETFLDSCFLCKNRLLPGKDIYMYRGDRAFCSVECRFKQILLDEESRESCGIVSIKTTCSSSSSGHRKNRAGGVAFLVA